MNIIRVSALLVATVSLPFVLQAQPTSAGSSGSSASPSRDASSSSSAGTYNASTDAASAMGSPSMQAVSKKSLETMLTAKNLLGKDVYDRDQKKIGKVEDLVFTGQGSSLNSAFSQGMDSASAMPDSSSTGTGSSRTSSGSSGTSGSMMHDPSMADSQIAVVISHGSKMGMGGDLIRVSLSQLSYDMAGKHLMLNAAAADLMGMSNPDSAARH